MAFLINTTKMSWNEWNESSHDAEVDVIGGLDYVRKHQALIIPYLSILCCTTLFGTLGNILLISAILRSDDLNHVGNYLVVNLAVADLIISLFVNSFAFVGALVGEVYFLNHEILCKTVGSACLIACYCSLFTLPTVSINRYLWICHHHIHEKIFTKKTTIVICVVIWIVAIAKQLSNFFNWGNYKFDRKAMVCLIDRTASLSHSVYFSVLGIGLPLVIASFGYGGIYLYVRKTKQNISRSNHNQASKKSRAAYVKLTHTLFMVFVAFFTCWSPFAVFFIWDHWDTLPQWPMLFAVVIGHGNSAINPILYGVTNTAYRKGYIKVLGLERCFPSASAKLIDSPSVVQLMPTSNTHLLKAERNATNINVTSELDCNAGS